MKLFDQLQKEARRLSASFDTDGNAALTDLRPEQVVLLFVEKQIELHDEESVMRRVKLEAGILEIAAWMRQHRKQGTDDDTRELKSGSTASP